VLDCRKINFEGASLSELALDHVSFQTPVSSVLNIWVLLSANVLMINDHKLFCGRSNGSLIYLVSETEEVLAVSVLSVLW
jgi:hypothetical protein